MYNVTLLEYDFLSETVLQRQLNGGTLLEEIIGNSLKYVTGDIPRERKIMMYSGDNRNLVGVLKNLNLWSPHIPNDAASLIFELYYDNDLRQYGIKVTIVSLWNDKKIFMCYFIKIYNFYCFIFYIV